MDEARETPPKKNDSQTEKSVNYKSTAIYNEDITVTGIPQEAYDYVDNGKEKGSL